MTGFVTRLTRQVPLVEQELLTRQEHLHSTPVFSGIRVTGAWVYVYVLWIGVCHFLLAIVLSVLRRFTDYPFGIFKLFFLILKWFHIIYDYSFVQVGLSFYGLGKNIE